ncbi:MAG: DUF3305 domain-containing protein [Cocleimonas sp.]
MREATIPLSKRENPVEILPASFPASVIMQSSPSSSQWVDEVWDAVGVITIDDNGDGKKVRQVLQGVSKLLIYSGLSVSLHLDECESYYHNLMSPEPGCFIVAREEDAEGNESDVPIPFLITLSFDEAHAYLEGDDIVYSVVIPAELYQWVEAYIVENYSAEKRNKRKRKEWFAPQTKAAKK